MKDVGLHKDCVTREIIRINNLPLVLIKSPGTSFFFISLYLFFFIYLMII